jgi:transposase-like protein
MAYGYSIDHATLEIMRMTAVRMVKRGIRVEDIAEGMRLNRSTVFGWLQKYRQHGLNPTFAIRGVYNSLSQGNQGVM